MPRRRTARLTFFRRGRNPERFGALEFGGEGWTEPELREAFERVQAKTHWKDPINARVRAEDQDITAAAIMFFTASEPTFREEGDGWLRVTAAGYRAGPAGDH